VAIFIRLDKSYESYERKVNDMISLLAAIGGLQKALFSIGMIAVSLVAQKVFMANIIHKVYQIRKYENAEFMDRPEGLSN
jgi:hypothetical protein